MKQSNHVVYSESFIAEDADQRLTLSIEATNLSREDIKKMGHLLDELLMKIIRSFD